MVTLHVSVWVEIVPFWRVYEAVQSRSTWACELKCSCNIDFWNFRSHAPRERVSWNHLNLGTRWECPRHAPRERVSWNHLNLGTRWECPRHAPRERVSWNLKELAEKNDTTGHAPRECVSWNIFCCSLITAPSSQSRSTWACELKLVCAHV